jgi:F-type H+-transporting ATPase subunit epsilon
MESDVLTLEVISPEKMVLSTKASRIELPGTLGRFVVLKDHAPLISSLTKGEIVYTSEDKENRIAVSSGFVKVEKNRIMACVEL